MALFLHSGLYKAFHAVLPDRLTVLAYHRVTDPHAPGFDTFKPTVSATPEAFAVQMDFLRRHFSVVTISQVVAWLRDLQPLPLHPALITFDDGYRDNFDHALPILQRRDLPAVIYLATDCIESISPFYWDLAAYCFHHTHRQRAALPLSGQREWHDERSRTTVMMDWLATLKTLPNDVQSTAAMQLPHVLGVSVPADAFAGLYLTWDQIRTMVATGIDMGAHTQSHAIMTRVSPEHVLKQKSGDPSSPLPTPMAPPWILIGATKRFCSKQVLRRLLRSWQDRLICLKYDTHPWPFDVSL
jgi:peptidoglycan/xylan/chitin deacetylase (PgdA/CDA1 family)